MSDIKVSNLSGIVIDSIIDEILNKIKNDNKLETIPQNQVLLYLCSLVLEHTKDSLKDNNITSEERVELITDVICLLVNQLPLNEPLKKLIQCFINDGDIQKLLEELDDTTSKQCRGCFGKVFRACIRSNNSK